MWIIIAVASYFLFAIVALVDKYLLSGPIPSPKFYAFSVGALGAVVALVLLPLGLVQTPEGSTFLFAFGAGALRVLALFAFFAALRRFDASRIVPAIGGFLPVATLLLILLLTDEGSLGGVDILAFVLLVGGSVGVSMEKQSSLTKASLKLSLIAALLFASSFFFSKFVYEAEPFWSGFFWILFGGLLVSLLFLLFSETREGISQMLHPKKRQKGSFGTVLLFLVNQGVGGLAFILQNWAVALVPFALLAFVNALEGTKYVFLLIVILFLSLRFPSILKEEISRDVFLQKALFVILIGAGLALLAV